MHGIIRASARLLVMAGAMGAVTVLATYAGLATPTAIALGLAAAGVVGLVAVMRRPRGRSAADEIAAMMAPQRAAAAAAANPERATAVEAMAPPHSRDVDPEANMPRWRRPSLLEARRSDPTRQAPAYRLPMRFTDVDVDEFDVRVVRYAVVPVLDRPDEVLGLRLIDLDAGDEVQVIGASGGFVEVHLPNGQSGWVHRTTLGQRPASTAPTPGFAPASEAEDVLTSLLSARGLS